MAQIDFPIPTSSSDCLAWVQYHKQLKKIFNSPEMANQAFLTTWQKRKGALDNILCAAKPEFTEYFDKEGIPVGFWGARFVSVAADTSYNTLTGVNSLAKSLKYTLPVAGVGALLLLGAIVWVRSGAYTQAKMG